MAKSLSDIRKSMDNWALTQVTTMQENVFTGSRDATPVKTGKAKAGWESTPINKIGATGIVKNDVSYIGWLEFGSDTVAPQAMVRNSIKKAIR